MSTPAAGEAEALNAYHTALRDSKTIQGRVRAALAAAEAVVRADERARCAKFVNSRREGLNKQSAYEHGKEMAYLSVLAYLAGQQ